MNPRVQLVVRQPECEDCRMCGQAEGMDRCVTAIGGHRVNLLVVGKKPWSERQLKEIETYLERAGFDLEDVAFTSAVKCRTWDLDPSNTDIKTCRQYIAKEIDFIHPRWVLCFGNEAMLSVTGKSGIMKHRGQVYPAKCGSSHTPQVISTISPAMVHRNPGQKVGFEADLTYVLKMMQGRDVSKDARAPDDQYLVMDTKEKIKDGLEILRMAHGVSFDIESNGFDEFKEESQIICICFSVWDEHSEGPIGTLALPLFHPESPWRNQWRRVMGLFYKTIMRIKKRVAHNGKFDCRWLREFGWDDIDITFDTMIAAHALDENRPKGLEPLSRSLLNTPPWKIDTSDLINQPLEIVLDYCGRDTWNTARLYFLFREQLFEDGNQRKARLFLHLLMPAANEFIATERNGVWVDREQLMTNWHITKSELDAVHEKLMEWVPEDHPFIEYYRDGRVKSNGINFGASNFFRWWLFDYLKLPVLKRGKTKDNGDPGAPSVDENTMLKLKGKHPVIDIHLERGKWYKYDTAFFSAYSEQLDSSSRIHTTFKVTGTVTGRLSSGKADADKVTSRVQARGVNLQQVPRDAFVRGIFGAPPGSSFVEFDYSQVELRIAAQIAGEQTMLNLYAQGADIHMTMAMRMTGKPESQISKEERKMAKAVNFGFLYGMGPTKFMETALNNYQLVVDEEQARAARTAFFAQFPQLLPWHARQRALAAKYKRVETPLGRVRHLPDIDSGDQQVRAEAERQAINSPVQGLASDLALLSFVLVSRQLRRHNLRAHAIGTVHDAINFEVDNRDLRQMLPIVKNTMENLPLRKLFGIRLDVPIIADCKLGTRWGGAKELTADQVYDFDLSILEAS